MTDRAQPGAIDSLIRNDELAQVFGRFSEGFVVPGSDPTPAAQRRGDINETALDAFSLTTSTTSLDVTVAPGEAFISGWVCRDVSTTLTLPANSTVDIVVGFDPDAIFDPQVDVDRDAADETVVDLAGNVDATTPTAVAHRVTTDGSGVTSNERVATVGSSASVNTLEATNTINTADISAASEGDPLQKAASGTDFKFGSVAGKFDTALSNGQVLADDGTLYDSIQTAENNASAYVFVGEGTFTEAVTISTTGLTIEGVGDGSFVDNNTGSSPAIEIDAADVVVKNLRLDGSGSDGVVNTTANADRAYISDVEAGGGSEGIALRNGSHHLVENCRVSNASAQGFEIESDHTVINSCVCRSSNQVGNSFFIRGAYCVMADCLVDSTGSNAAGVVITANGAVINNNSIINAGEQGIVSSANDVIVSDNRIHNAAQEGIDVNGTDNIIANNRVSDSGNSDIDTSGATTPETDSNVTGAQN